MLESLFSSYDSVIVLDTETTGVNCRSDEIIELGFLRLDRNGERTEEDYLIRLSPGRRLPPVITQLTGIREDELFLNGVEKEVAAEAFVRSLAGEKPLVCAYNAQFDLCFLYYFLQRLGQASALKGVKMLDAMTVYKDRRPYPHKLANAVDAYRLKTQNTHRAIDDAKATLELLAAMDAERPDLAEYLNLFGYNPKFGVSGPKIASIHYLPQGYDSAQPLYMQDLTIPL